MTEMDKDPSRVLSIILNMRKTYTEYFDQVNKAENQCDQI